MSSFTVPAKASAQSSKFSLITLLTNLDLAVFLVTCQAFQKHRNVQTKHICHEIALNNGIPVIKHIFLTASQFDYFCCSFGALKL